MLMKLEAFRGDLYNDQADHCTIGYGHLVHYGKCDGSESKEFRNGITKEQAKALLIDDIAEYEDYVKKHVTVPLTQNQFDALVCFVYNVGGVAFKGSTLLKLLNKKAYNGASNQFPVWNKVRIDGQLVVSGGLVKRRKAEKDLFDK